MENRFEEEKLMIKTEQVWKPAALSEAWMLFQHYQDDCCFVAGGTWLRTQWEAGTLNRPSQLISLESVPEISSSAEKRGDSIFIGSLARLSALIEDPLIQEELPELAKACARTAAPSIRNQATIGGNVLTRIGDTLPSLLIYNAELIWFDGNSTVEEMLEDWLQTVKKESRILVGISLPLQKDYANMVMFYMKTGRRETFIPSQVSVAGRISCDENGDVIEAALAAGGGNAIPVRLRKSEALFKKSYARNLFPALVHQQIKEEFNPPSDVFASAAYKKRVAANLIVSEWYRKGCEQVASK